jgi:S-adenosylmethionine decarboxylase
MKDLAPTIHRQRLIIEGISEFAITSQHIKEFLSQLSDKIEMVTLLEPVTHQSAQYGWAGWIHWETSGAHFYAWDEPEYFFSCDIYTCKPFNVGDAVQFAQGFFNTNSIEYKEF